MRGLLVPLLVLAVVAAGCGDDEAARSAADSGDLAVVESGAGGRVVTTSTTDPASLPSPAPVNDSVVVKYIEPDRAAVGLVTWIIEVKNTTQAPVTLTFASGQQADIVLLDGKAEIHRWSNDRFFTTAMVEVVLEAGAVHRVELPDDVTAVPPGRYRLVAELTAVGPPEPDEGRVRLTSPPP